MDFSGYLSNVKVNLTFSSNFVHTLKSSNSANEIPIHSNPLDAMTYAHLVFAFFDTFQVHSGNNSCSRYSTVFVLKKKKESLFFLNCAR